MCICHAAAAERCHCRRANVSGLQGDLCAQRNRDARLRGRLGPSTGLGVIAGRLRLRPPETEFERGVRRYGYLLTQLMLLLVLAAFAANILLHRAPIESLLFALALAVGLSPELLPAIVSVTLAAGARTMAGQGVIVRRLRPSRISAAWTCFVPKDGDADRGRGHLTKRRTPTWRRPLADVHSTLLA